MLPFHRKPFDFSGRPGGRSDTYGYGRIEATAALRMLRTGSGRDCEVTSDCGPGAGCEHAVGGMGALFSRPASFCCAGGRGRA